MAIKERMSGNEAVSYAIRQVNPDVMPAFPITPSTEIPQMVSTYIANGEMDTEFIPVESEHSSMSAAIGSEAAGARSLTATSSAGLALMWEELLLAASNRLPLALTLVNRTLSGPININCDHSDGMGARDTGWIQIYAENNQEAYDNFIQAYPIAEDTRVHLPIMICQDGFITSHAVENIMLLEDELVKDFVGEYEPEEFCSTRASRSQLDHIQSATMQWKPRKIKKLQWKIPKKSFWKLPKNLRQCLAENMDYLRSTAQKMLIISY